MQKPSVQNGFYQNRSILLKFLLCLFFVFEGQEILAQTDSTDQLKFDVGITRNKNRHLWPIIYRENNEESKDLQLAFTLYQHKEVFDSNYVHSHLLPFYYKSQKPSHTVLKLGTVVYPSLFEYVADSFQKRKSYRLVSLLPDIELLNFTTSNNGLYLENNAFFFVYFKNDVVLQKTHLVVFPLYWYYKNQNKISHTLFPILTYKSEFEQTINSNSEVIKKSLIKNLNIYPLLTFTENIHSSSRNYKEFEDSSAVHDQRYFLLFSNYLNKDYIITDSTMLDFKYHHISLFPLFNYEETWRRIGGTEFKSFRIFPLYFNVNRSYQSSLYAGLLYYSLKSNPETINCFFPIWFNRSIDIVESQYSIAYNKRQRIITPFFWHFTYDQPKYRKSYNRTVLFPLYWDFKEDTFTNNRWKMIFPIYFASNLQNSKYTIRSLGMLMWWGKKPTYNFKLLVPLYLNSQNTNGDTFSMFTPLVWHYQTRTLKGLTIFPLYFGKTYANGNFSKLLFPLFLRIRTKTDTTLAIFPFYWNGHYSNTQWTKILLPFYFNIRNEEVWTKFVFPFYYSQYNYDFKERITGILPLYWVLKTNAGEVNRVFFPLVFTSKFGSKSSFTVFPLYWQYKDKNASTKILFPLFFAERNQTDTNLVLFPLIWKHHGKETQSLVLPFYIHIKDIQPWIYSATSYGYLFWKIKGLNTSKHFLFPLYYSSKKFYGRPADKELLHSTLAITPFYWRSNYLKKGQNGWVQNRYLLPIYYSFHSQNKNIRYFPPIYWSKTSLRDTSLVFAPLFYHKMTKSDYEYENRTLLIPIYLRLRVKSIYVDHLNFREDYKLIAVTPLFYTITKYTCSHISVFEINQGKAIQDIDTSFTRETMLFPLFYNKLTYTLHKPSEQNRISGITPLYWHIKTPYRNHIRFWPLFNYVKDVNNIMHFNVLYGLIRRDYDSSIQYKSTSVIWPLIQNEHLKGVHRFHIAPFLWIKNSPNHSYNVLFPLYSWSKKFNTTRMSFLWQVYKYKAIEGRMSGHRFLFRAYLRDRYTNGDFETRFLHKVYVNMQKDSATEKTIFPLYSKRIKKNGDYYKWYALGLFSKSKTKIPSTKEFYLEEKLLWFIRFRSNAGYLKSKGIQFKKGN